MPSQLFIIAVTCYLVSVIAALTLSFFVKLIPSPFVVIMIVIHFIMLGCWFFLNNYIDAGSINYFFLASFCLGILTSGIILRSGFPIYLKLYFSIFLLSLPVFIIAPSRVLGFIVTGNFTTANPQRFHLSGNYYLVEQQGTSTPSYGDTLFFKMVREMGVFHSTLARDIQLPRETDSVIILSNPDENPLWLRGYYLKEQHTDSFDIRVTNSKKVNPDEVKQLRRH